MATNLRRTFARFFSMRFTFLLLLLQISCAATAQEIQNSASYLDIPAPHYFRFNYENDFVFHTDYYYTQGVHFELVSPKIGRLPTRHLLFHPVSCETRYGIGLESAGYTATSITADTIQYGDRPFAGMAYAKAFAIAVNEAHHYRLSSTLSIGLMGPAVGGYEIQAYIHRQLGNLNPVAWKYQVKNQVILNYEANMEQAVFMKKAMLVSVCGLARAGTLSTKAALGAVVMAGLFNNPFRPLTALRKVQAYVYVHPQADFVGYDATMQGGPFTKNNPYTIPTGDLRRFVFRSDEGLRLSYGRLTLGAYVRYVGKEFITAKTHAAAGAELAIVL